MIVKSIKRYNWQGKKVLIAEDDPAGSFLLSEILVHTRIDIKVVWSGTEAVEVCRNDPDIDIVLMDMQIPGISGYEAARKIRNMRKELPIIAQSAFVLTEDKDRALEAGCNVHISKPLNTFELLGTMHRLLYNTDKLPM
ncbi:MAG: response regulator [Bacteroidales bacterium]|nr:response regulator [Bacteroidales bacterium]